MEKELQVEITEENYKRAVTAASGGCIVADAIKAAYPKFSTVKVNIATIRVTDRESGERGTYLTPPSVGQTLLYYDQGWDEKKLPKKLRIRDLVRVTPITRSESSKKSYAALKLARLAQLESKEASGTELTPIEKTSLTKMRNPKFTPIRPKNEGKGKAEGSERDLIIRGGRDRAVEGSKKNPNLLAGRTRHFGAKLAEPSQVFKEAVEKETAKRVEEALRIEREKQL
jgi:hypothetical protein